MTIEIVKIKDSFAAMIDGKVICSMSTGSAQRFRMRSEAENHANKYASGFTGGNFLGSAEDWDIQPA